MNIFTKNLTLFKIMRVSKYSQFKRTILKLKRRKYWDVKKIRRILVFFYGRPSAPPLTVDKYLLNIIL